MKRKHLKKNSVSVTDLLNRPRICGYIVFIYYKIFIATKQVSYVDQNRFQGRSGDGFEKLMKTN